MKKILITFSVFAMIFISVMSVSAYSNNDIDDYVVDSAILFTAYEEEKLEEKIDEIRKKYNYDIVLLTVYTFEGKSAAEFADDYYDSNGFSSDGMLFVINMTYRDYYTSTTGYGITAFTDYGLDTIHDIVKPYLSDGDYYEAFDKYLDLSIQFLDEAKENKPFDTNNKYKEPKIPVDIVKNIFLIVVVCFIISLVYVTILKAGMNTARKRTEATEYRRVGSLNMRMAKDTFLFTTTSKHKIQSSSGGHSRGGGSSHHRSRSGRSHGGRGGKF